MKKGLLQGTLAVAALVMAMSAQAETKVYDFATGDPFGPYPYGQVYGMSPNGQYAIIYAEDWEESYLWDRSNPEVLTLLCQDRDGEPEPLQMYGVNNAGTMVGSVRSGNQWLPFVQEKDGPRIPLPLPEGALNLNYAIGISENGNIIGGQYGGSNGVEGIGTWGANFPIVWVKQEDGSWKDYPCTDYIGAHQGTFVNTMYTDGTLEGTWLGGTCGAGAASYIPFLYNNGKMKFFNELTQVTVNRFWNGRELDPDHVELIDGLRDNFEGHIELNAGFTGVDFSGNFYGTRAEVYDVVDQDEITSPEDQVTFGDGKARYYGGFYNVHTGEWTEELGGNAAVGLEGRIIFNGMDMKIDGAYDGVENYYSTSMPSGLDVLGVERVSADGSVLAMCHQQTDNTGLAHLCPLILVSDKQLTGVEVPVVDRERNVTVLTYKGGLEVIGAEEVAVYDMNGMLVSTARESTLSAGIYVVVADNEPYKVIVK